tara:strand:+ start:412 stop:1095 length:684 start_codon:yes stop_codon:yes gene_type:complete
MNLNEIKLEQNETAVKLNVLFTDTFIALKKKLLTISDKTDFLKAICDLNYIRNDKYKEENIDSYEDIISTNNLDSICFNRKKNYFKCLCGKTHLTNLNFFTLKNIDTTLIIGSTCIEQIFKLTEVHYKNSELLLKINDMINLIDRDILKKENKPCLKCGDYSIKKDKNYKNIHRKYLCKTCIVKGNFIFCSNCPKKVKIEYIRNTVKLLCKSCWWKNRQMVNPSKGL